MYGKEYLDWLESRSEEEITPEMIEAGAEAAKQSLSYMGYDVVKMSRWLSPNQLAEDIYCAMQEARG